ncbi:hypothetical protein V8E36_004140 [Tilletia maclaganii]
MQIEIQLANRLVPISIFVALALALGRVGLVLYRFITGPSKVAHLPGAPVVHWFFGSWDHSPVMRGSAIKEYERIIQQYGRAASAIEVNRRPAVVLADFGAFLHVFLKKAMPKAARSVRTVRRHVGRGLIGESGLVHRRQRKIAFPAFTQEAVDAMSGAIIEKAQQLISNLEALVPPGQAPLINISSHWTKFTLDVIGKVGFDYEFGALTSAEKTSLEIAYEHVGGLLASRSVFAAVRIEYGIMEILGRLFRVKEQLVLDKNKAHIAQIGRELIGRARRRYERSQDHVARSGYSDEVDVGEQDGSSMEGRDLLSMMTLANMGPDLKPHQRLSDDELTSMIPTFIFAGHETSSTALSWASYALTQPGHGMEVQRRLREELLESNGAWKSGADGFDTLPYLDAVVRETLRLHSPVRLLTREASEDIWVPYERPVPINGVLTKEVFVPKGALIVLPLNYLNKDEELWGDGLAFRPERWLPESHEYFDASAPVPPHVRSVWSSLASFGTGPANCIGQRLAVREVSIGLAALLSQFELLPPNEVGQPGPKVDHINRLVAHPFVVGEEAEGSQLPVRIRRLSPHA